MIAKLKDQLHGWFVVRPHGESGYGNTWHFSGYYECYLLSRFPLYGYGRGRYKSTAVRMAVGDLFRTLLRHLEAWIG